MATIRTAIRDPYRWLEAVLGGFLVVIAVQNTIELIRFHSLAVDIQIPLRAAERWLAGGDPYPLSAFDASYGPDLPFLYAPYVLPLVAPLTVLPVEVVVGAALLGAVCVAAWAIHRLGVAWRFVPLVLLWPPFVEGIVGTNVEVLGFAALVALVGPGAASVVDRRAAPAALLTAATFVFKAAQLQVLAFMAFRRPRVAIAAVIGVGGLALVMLPAVGLDQWWAWLASGVRAGDPSWPVIGAPLSTLVPRPVALIATAASILVATRVGGPHAVAWLGLLIIVGAPTLHLFGFIYLLPALLLLRRDLALALAALTATAISQALWVAVAATALLLLASRRWSWVLRRGAG